MSSRPDPGPHTSVLIPAEGVTPDQGNPMAMLHVKPDTAAQLAEANRMIAECQDFIARTKHESWARMKAIRDLAQQDQGAEMAALRAIVEPLERAIDQMRATMAERGITQPLDAALVPAGAPALMVF